MNITPPFSQSSDRDALIDSQAQYLQNYRQQIEDELLRLSNQALNRWLQDSDAAFRRALQDVTELALSEITQALNESLANNLTASTANSSRSSNASASSTAASLAGAVTSLVTSQVSSLLFSEQTSTSRQETDRSAASRNQLRLSRSQQQAALARQNSQGQRNL